MRWPPAWTPSSPACRRRPPPRARELVAQFEAYQTAQAAAFPPGQAPLVPEEGLAQLRTMQALRAAHFGAEAAQQMFAQDDAVARRILELHARGHLDGAQHGGEGHARAGPL